MKKLVWAAALAAAFVICAPAQEPPKESSKETAKNAEPEDDMLGWKWANFALLAGGLGFMMSKSLPKFFESRNREIKESIAEAATMKTAAFTKVAAIEQKVAGAATEIERMRGQLKTEMTTEGQRIQQETERIVARIHEQAKQEIEYATKASRQELKKFSAALAIEIATARIQGRMTEATQNALIADFLSGLRRGGAGKGTQASK